MTKRKPIFLFFFLFLYIIGNAQVSKTVNATTPGTLSTLLTQTELNTITNLTLTGNIDARDFKTMRDNMTKLSYVNIGDASISFYYGWAGTTYIQNYKQNEIPENAFYYLFNLKTIIFPKGLTSIADGAFSDCRNLSGTLNLPSTITNLGASAFYNCYGLNGVLVLPPSLQTIGNWCFN